MESYKEVVFYHLETKHHPHRLARSLGYLDWANQPNPFRFWEGTLRVELPLLKDEKHPYEALYDYRLVNTQPFNINTLSKFLELSFGLSAWKAIPGSRWSVRMNPSSGNLHPTECYLIIPDLGGLSGVFHYNPFLHALEKRAEIPKELAQEIKDFFGTEGFIVVLSSIPWREAWKYGERAYRYCLLDTGHAIGTLRFSANLKGWKVKYLNALSDEELRVLLGFDRVEWIEGEEEFPEGAFFVFPKEVREVPRSLPPQVIKKFQELRFYGKPNKLSNERVIWEIIYEAIKATEKPRTEELKIVYASKPLLTVAPSYLSAEEVIRKRRSAHLYDPKVKISQRVFLQALDRCLPREDYSPFDVEITPTYLNLFIFLHRVEGLESGLYAFVRNERHLKLLKELTSPEFLWERVYDEIPLYLLALGDFREFARYVACVQEIASDSAFSLGMLSLFEPVLKEKPWEYKLMHWEAGLIGQVLYLEATAHELKGTGIGCFFDDVMHELLGLSDKTFQDLYHFAFGKGFEDPRIQTIEPYYHLKGRIYQS